MTSTASGIKVVHVAAYFAPAWASGGPARSMLALCQAQQAAGLDVEVFTTTANGVKELPPQPEGALYEGIPVKYFSLGSPRALFAAPGMWRPLSAAIASADVVHVHGMFNATVWMATHLARGRVPYVISPRGMLQTAALGHHRWRKRAAWHLFERTGIRAASRLHATSAVEAATLRQVAADIPVIEIPNPVPVVSVERDDVAHATQQLQLPSQPYVLFLGRIHPIKRLDLLTRAFGEVLAVNPDMHLVIAGPDERGTRATIEPLSAAFSNRVHWTGAVDGPIKRGLLAGAEALVLCSDSESFGMSAAEAMAVGTPVVVTRTCPWQSIESAQCGFWVEQTPGAIAAAIIAISQDQVAARLMGVRGRALIGRDYAPNAIGRRWRDAYAEIAPRALEAPASCA